MASLVSEGKGTTRNVDMPPPQIWHAFCNLCMYGACARKCLRQSTCNCPLVEVHVLTLKSLCVEVTEVISVNCTC